MLASLVSASHAPPAPSPERTVHAGPRPNTHQPDLKATRLAAQRMKGFFSALARSKLEINLVWLLLLLAYVNVGRVVLVLMSTKAELDQQLLAAAAYSEAAAYAPDGSAPTDLELGTLHAGRGLDSQEGRGGGLRSSNRLGGRRGLRPPHSSLSVSAPSRTLQFKVCNGFTNQRLSLVYGILLAVKTGRVPVVPCMLPNGEQLSTATISAGLGDAECEAFGHFYDEQFFVQQMLEGGVHVLTQAVTRPATELSAESLRSSGSSILQRLNSTASGMAHVSMDCALWALQPAQIEPADERLIWHTLGALRPAAHLQAKVSKTLSLMREQGASRFNYLHLRIERDWVQHCKRWSAIPDGQVRDNCYNNTDSIATMLDLFWLRKEVPLYVASDWEEVDAKARPLRQLVESGYRLISSLDFDAELHAGLGREGRALVEYYVAFNAHRFIGNSVSTFSSLLMLERRHRGQWAAYYNGGNVPLAVMLPPLMKMPWVFTYNSGSSAYDYMLKAAVHSGITVGNLKPYCIFMGDTQSPIYGWLQSHNVTLIHHQPAWRDKLLQLIDSQSQVIAGNKDKYSHLYASPDTIVSTFQRVDLPMVSVLDQYSYVLYTDSDVYFRRPVTLNNFGLPLPPSISMAYEAVDMFPYNAGVMLAHLPELRANHEDLVSTMLDPSNSEGLQFPGYGPMDQGLLNKFYEQDLRAHMLSQDFNAKPYHDLRADPYIIHFHGPKPHDYFKFMESGKCRFGDMCHAGFQKALCPYIQEWAVHLPDSYMAAKLDGACEWLVNPGMKSLFTERWGLQKPAYHATCKMVVEDD